MKAHITLGAAVAAALLAGCCTTEPKGPAYGHKQEFRQQIMASVPVQKWGYKIEDIRFTRDFRKALVIFDTPEDKRQEVTFEDDGFGRYHGELTDNARWRHAVTREDAVQGITVTFPDR